MDSSSVIIPVAAGHCYIYHSRTMSGDSLISVIVVNWNGLHLLDECLNSLARQKWKQTEFILVDTAQPTEAVISSFHGRSACTTRRPSCFRTTAASAKGITWHSR